MRSFINRITKLALFIFATALFSSIAFAQSTSPTSESIVEKTAPSVVVILTGKGDGLLGGLATGVIVRADGVILTAYHVVKDAAQLQIRLKNGEIYDRVDLLGFDERRDIAALKIVASDLPAVQFRADEPKIGEKVFTFSNPNGLNWSTSDGLLSATRLADEIPNAGKGFRLLQFTAPIANGSSGGLLTDENGLALGLIIGRIATTENLNFAVPISSVKGLIDTTQKTMSFGRGTSLELPLPAREPSSIDILGADSADTLRNAKIIYISTSSELINEKMLENGLMKRPEFQKWNLVIVRNPKNADIEINVEHQLFTFDYRFTMTDRRTGIVLGSSKVTVWDGQMASRKFSGRIMDILRPFKEPPPKAAKKDGK